MQPQSKKLSQEKQKDFLLIKFFDLYVGNQTYSETIYEIYSDAQGEIFDIRNDEFSLKLTCEMVVGTYFMGMMHLHEILNDSLEVNAEK